MSLQPFLNAALSVQVHALAALAASVFAAVQFYRSKGTSSHRVIGYIWVGLMMLVAASSLAIHEIRLIGPFSPIHLLSIQVITTLPLAVAAARRGEIDRHRRHMRNLVIGALVVAGLLTFAPGRLMHTIVFG